MSAADLVTPIVAGVVSTTVVAATVYATRAKAAAAAAEPAEDGPQVIYEHPLSHVIPATQPGESYTVRHWRAREEMQSEPPCDEENGGIRLRTLTDVMLHVRSHHPHKLALGRRRLRHIHEEEKVVTKIVAGKEVSQTKTWLYYEMGPYEWMSADEAASTSAKIGAGLVELGIKPKHDRLCLFAATSRDWMLVAHACFSQAITITTAYDTLGASGLLHSLNEAEVPAVFCNNTHIPTILKIAPQAKYLRLVIYDGEITAAQAEQVIAAHTAGDHQLRFVSLDSVIAEGTLHPIPRTHPDPEDLACIMYTSGSTGAPKGVEITHKNVIAAMAGIHGSFGHLLNDTDEMYLAYLPCAHVLEFAIETYALWRGISLGYGSPKTLTDASMRNCVGDIKELKPTILAGVPAVWDSIKKGVENKLRAMPRPIQAAFNAAVKLKQMSLIRGMNVNLELMDSVLFGAIKAETGGRLRTGVAGGAPLSADTQLFISAVICPLLQGYGLTESLGMSAVRVPEYGFATRNIGVPMPDCEFKLVDVPEAGYVATGNPPKGELWIRGPAVSSGYFKQPELTAETFTEDGWLKTGDIAMINPHDHTLTIIDRRKNLVKLSNGEYIALERLESIYAASHYLAKLCIYGDSEHSFAIAIGVPHPPAIKALAASQGINVAGMSWEQLCQSDVVKAAVVKDLAAIAKANALAPAEIPRAVILGDEEWTPQNQLLTAAMKLQRRNVVAKFKAEIDAIYAA
ncbi:long-chain fatty acid-CoA ligase [Allomyces arbusculus]|nr:long-chain fatty acid-CoA ligase [Allomyces arbusculus]